MVKKRYIFDLDRTLLTCDYRLVESILFEPIFKDKTEYLMDNIADLLNNYEMSHEFYDDELLSEFLTKESGLEFTPEIIDKWAKTMMSEADILEDGVIEVLDYLKRQDKSLVVLTNWYGNSQIGRLKNADIYDYFDDVFTGEYQLKPHSDAYLAAMGKYKPHECLMIGDSLIKDYLAPRLYGMDAVLYDKDDIHEKEYVKIKKLNELIKK